MKHSKGERKIRGQTVPGKWNRWYLKPDRPAAARAKKRLTSCSLFFRGCTSDLFVLSTEKMRETIEDVIVGGVDSGKIGNLLELQDFFLPRGVWKTAGSFPHRQEQRAVFHRRFSTLHWRMWKARPMKEPSAGTEAVPFCRTRADREISQCCPD